MISIHDSGESVTFAVKVHPRAKTNAITGKVGDALKISVTAPPVEGKANQACVDFFANLLKVPRTCITIASGQSGRQTIVSVKGLAANQISERLGF